MVMNFLTRWEITGFSMTEIHEIWYLLDFIGLRYSVWSNDSRLGLLVNQSEHVIPSLKFTGKTLSKPCKEKSVWCTFLLSIFRRPLHVSGISRPIIKRYNLLLIISCAPSWFFLHDYIEMHGQQNIKFSEPLTSPDICSGFFTISLTRIFSTYLLTHVISPSGNDRGDTYHSGLYLCP